MATGATFRPWVDRAEPRRSPSAENDPYRDWE